MQTTRQRERTTGWAATLVAAVMLALPFGLLLPLALLLPLYALCLPVARRIGPTFVARFDDGAMQVAPAAEPPAPLQAAAASRLQDWCFEGAGSGRSPLLRPWRLPQVDTRFSVAVLAGGPGTASSRLAAACSRHLDGTDLLAALPGPWSRRALRLRVKLHDCLWWRRRQRSDPWDCGYLVDAPAALCRLQQFRPRRATLMIADGLPAEALLARIAALETSCMEFAHPVRLLVVGGARAEVAPLRGVSFIEP